MTLDTAKIDALTAGLTYAAEFVPFSKSRNTGTGGRDRWESINWRIRLERGGTVLETDYAQGTAYLPKSCRSGEATAYAIEHGRELRYTLRRLLPPPLADVLSCLLLDASVIDYPNFESWAGDFGLDTDSRKAEVIYRACLETGLKLRAMFGDSGLAELRELFQDY